MDVVLAHKHGVKNIVCTLGTSFTENHALFLKNKGMTPCFCFDSDEAGKKAAKRAVEMMAELEIYAKVFFIPEGKDMAEFANYLGDGTEDYIASHAMAYWQYELQEALTVYDAAVQEARRQAMPSIMAACSGINSNMDKIVMQNFVKERFGVAL